MTKEDLEKLLQDEKDHVEQLKTENTRLRNLQPISEVEFALLKERLENAEKNAEYWRIACEQARVAEADIKAAAELMHKDNQALMNGTYHPGITLTADQIVDARESIRMAAENRKLKAKLEEKEKAILYYRSLVRDQIGKDPEEITAEIVSNATSERKPAGRPRTIDDKTKARIRKLRREGLTVREIASREGVSVGAVTGICKSVNRKI